MNNIFDRIENQILADTLDIRYHSGIGFMQAYISPHVRIHVWHPELPGEIGAFGCLHDHRFDLESHVLYGTICNTMYRAHSLAYEDNFSRYRVQPAHLGPKELQYIGNADLNMLSRNIHNVGSIYTVPMHIFHETNVKGLTVTLMVKKNQSPHEASVIAPVWQKPVHIMDSQPSKTVMRQLFFNAIRKINREIALPLISLVKYE